MEELLVIVVADFQPVDDGVGNDGSEHAHVLEIHEFFLDGAFIHVDVVQDLIERKEAFLKKLFESWHERCRQGIITRSFRHRTEIKCFRQQFHPYAFLNDEFIGIIHGKKPFHHSMIFHVLTLFPELFKAFQKESIIGRALKGKKAKIQLVNIRDFGLGKHKKVDDTVYGGGDGMLMKCEPLFGAIEKTKSEIQNSKKILTISLSPRGKKLTQAKAEQLSKYSDIILLCGRYEGVDQRVIDELVDEEISIGDYVLSGGELPAMVLMEAVIRLLPGVLGKEGSHEHDSFSKAFGRKKEYPQYTKPAEFRGLKVPEVLLSGNHAEIEKWRKSHLK